MSRNRSVINQGSKGTVPLSTSPLRDDEPRTHLRQSVRLSPEQYRALEAKFIIDRRVTDPIQAGIQLGIQQVLQELRNGFTVDQ